MLIICQTTFSQKKSDVRELNGKKFSVNMTLAEGKKSSWQWKSDEITFRSTKIKSKTMFAREHFSPADFIITINSEGQIHVTAISKNPGGSEIKWDLTITGDQLQGTATWTNKQGEQTYLVKGSRMK